jgi:ribosome maturation factor RimP
MGSGDERRLQQVVAEVTAAAGYDLEELTVRAAGRRRVVRVVIDADAGVTLDAAAEISRAISERLDAAGEDDPTGTAPYTLEVTSPGIGRPLTLPRHFRRARTRLVVLVTADGKQVTGHVAGVSDSAVELVLSGRKGVSQVQVPFADIERARVEVEFSRPPAAVLALLGVDQRADGDDHDDLDDDEPDDEDDQENEDGQEDADREDADHEDEDDAASTSTGSVTG